MNVRVKKARRVVGTKVLRGFDRSVRGRGEAAERRINKGLWENFWNTQVAPKKGKERFCPSMKVGQGCDSIEVLTSGGGR